MHIFDDFRLTHWAEKIPGRIAVDDGRRAVSYQNLEKRAASLGAYLQNKGLSSEDCVLVCLPNCCEMVTLSFAAVKLGFVMVLGNIQYKQHELQYVIDMSNPRLAILSEEEQVDMIKEIDPTIKIIKLDLEGEQDSLDFIPEGRITRKNEFSMKSPMLIICTSGSTGRPKGVLLSRENLLYSSLNVAERFQMDENDVSYVPVPLCHMFGFSGMMISIITGGTLLLTRRFKADKALALMENEGVTVQYAVATMYAREIECYENLPEKPNLSRLRTGMISGSPGVKSSIIWFDEKLGCRLLNAYGMSEAPSLAMVDYDDPVDVRYNSCGRQCKYSQLAIIREDGSFAGTSESGEIVCRGATLMLGYKNQENLGNSSTADGWFMTGDIGVLNPDGTFSIVGRKKDIIIRGGYNVAPTEVESVFYESGLISEACAVGYPSEAYGEEIALFAVLNQGENISPESLLEKIRPNISKYKLPGKIVFMDELPKLPNRKIDKLALKKMLI